eukprot:jgi/Undpi1/8851/HiC_scaffold_25.g11313.m1
MRVSLATARALGFASRRARRGRRPCFAEPGAPNPRGPQSGPRTSGPRTTSVPEGRMFEDFVMARSQLGAVAMLATQIRAVCSGLDGFGLELEGEGDDDDGT